MADNNIQYNINKMQLCHGLIRKKHILLIIDISFHIMAQFAYLTKSYR